ncbi:MAG: cobyrinate a,c-diamide synthase [Chloroflexi bacterium]|nr:cobyrinate a,c-diamide synthase [Chloroflexota bacterium]
MTPAFVIAGVRSGVGKTTVATGIMGALTRRGHRVQPFKAGPDYIDPTYHALACGVPSRNLDTWLLPHRTVIELFQRASALRDVSVVEGVMGLFDGHSSLSEEGSTAELAKLLEAPVILVADASKVARSVAAEILGYQQFDPNLKIAGVILNGVGSPRHLEFCQPQIEATTGLPVLGYLPRREELAQPERHLGLIPTVEGTVARRWYDTLVDQVEETIDVERILQLAGASSRQAVEPEIFPREPQPKRAVIAIARDKAFSFYYQDSLDLLEAWGAELAPFSPMEDARLPEGAGGIYLGGGFPEMFAAQLAENAPMHAAIRDAVARGVPVYAECGGLMYLGQSLRDLEGVEYPMLGLIPAVSAMSNRRLTMGYRELESRTDSPVLRRGQRVRGHEFHWSTLEQPPDPDQSVYRVLDQGDRADGFQVGSIWASYVHIHLASDPSLARRFVDSCAPRSTVSRSTGSGIESL